MLEKIKRFASKICAKTKKRRKYMKKQDFQEKKRKKIPIEDSLLWGCEILITDNIRSREAKHIRGCRALL